MTAHPASQSAGFLWLAIGNVQHLTPSPRTHAHKVGPSLMAAKRKFRKQWQTRQQENPEEGQSLPLIKTDLRALASAETLN